MARKLLRSVDVFLRHGKARGLFFTLRSRLVPCLEKHRLPKYTKAHQRKCGSASHQILGASQNTTILTSKGATASMRSNCNVSSHSRNRSIREPWLVIHHAASLVHNHMWR